MRLSRAIQGSGGRPYKDKIVGAMSVTRITCSEAVIRAP